MSKSSEEELRQQIKELRVLQSVLLDITKPHELSTLLNTIVERAVGLLEGTSGGMYLCYPHRQEVVCVVSYNTPADYRGNVLKYGEGAAGIVARKGKPLIIEDYEKWNGRAAVYEKDRPFGAVISVPMIWQEQVTGVIHVLDDAERRRFTENELDILTVFAGHAAIAVGYARLLEQTQKEIAERREKEEELRVSEKKYRVLLENTPDVVMRFDREYRHTYVSPSIRDVMGMNPEEFIGKRHRDLDFPKELVNFWEERIRSVFAGEKPICDQFEISVGDKTLVFDWRLIPEVGSDGRVKSVYTTARDITEQKRSEEALRLSQERFQFAVGQIPGTIWTTDDQFRFTLSEGGGLGEIGLSPGQVVGMNLYEFFQTEEEILPIKMHRRALKGESVSYEYDQQGTVFETFLEPYRNSQGKIIGVLGIAFNVTKRRQSERALQENEARLRAIIESSPDAITTTDLQGIISACNQATLRLHGFSREEEIIGTNSLELIAPQHRDKALSNFQRTLEQGSIRDVEYFMTTKSGEQFPAELSASVIKNNDGNPVAFVGITKDIRQRKKAEEELRSERDRAAQYFNIAGVMLLVIDTDQRVQRINQKGCEILEYEEEEILGKNWFDHFLPKEDRDQVKGIFDKLMSGEIAPVERVEGQILTKSGKQITISWYNTVIRDDSGTIVGTLSSGEDLTEQKRNEAGQRLLEDQLRQSHKMEMIGRLAGGVAHDFNNLLTVITGTSELALGKLSAADAHYEEFSEIRATTERAVQLTNQLLTFSRKQIVEPRIIDLNRVIMDMEKLFHRLLGEDIRLSIRTSDDLWPVKMDRGQFEQVLTNFLVNARDAMPGGGKITVETANFIADDEYVRAHIDMEPGSYVMISVSDTGAGMDEVTKSKIFEPFFTTKRKGEGIGLGLSTCYGIVKQNGGIIDVYSEPGQGTIFKVYIPSTDERKTQKSEKAGELQGGTETVLLVEDEPNVRKMVNLILTTKGYSVMQAADGEQAMRLATRKKGIIDLLLTDVVMPKMGGKDLAVSIVDVYPEIKVLYMSGYTDNAIVHHGVLDPGVFFLQKPFTPSALLRKVREVLDN